jgi:voltage-gated potassium channel
VSAPSLREGAAGSTPGLRRWETVTYWPLTVVALLFVIVYTVQVIGRLDGGAQTVTNIVIGGTWIVFAVDYLARLLLARPRGRWFRAHLFDLAVVFIPTLRPIRLLGALTRLASFRRSAASSLRARLIVYGLGAALLMIWQISLWVLSVERDAPGADIRSFGDAIWWAFCTVTTVGYGDFAPVTPAGRFFAVLLMAGGVVLVGLIVATFSSWVMERVTRGHEEQRPATRGDVRRILEALDARPADAVAGGVGRSEQPESGETGP